MQLSHFVMGLLAAAVATACSFTLAPSAPSSAASVTSAGLEYQSAFESYRAYEELELISWQRANDEAGALGGHGGHAGPTATSSPSPVSKPEDAAASKKPPAAAAPVRSPTTEVPQKTTVSPAAKTPAGAGHAGHGK